MNEDIKSYVTSSQVCQHAKTEHNKLSGLLQPLPVPKSAWHTISMDFIGGLPKSKKYDTILVVIDKFSKYAHFVALSHPYTVASIAQLFLDSIYKLHGMPMVIISDRDKVFTSNLWKEIFKLPGTTLWWCYQTQGTSINAWKHTFVVWYMSVQTNVLLGYYYRNFGIILYLSLCSRQNTFWGSLWQQAKALSAE